MSADLEVSLPGFDLSLVLQVEGVVAFVGPNGSGKTTALRALLGVVPVRGSVALDGRELGGVPTEARRIGYVPQNGALFEHLDVARNVSFGLPKGAAVEPILEDFGLLGLADRRPASLSGGQRQRVALARALATQPRALLLDEPLSALDIDARVAVRRKLGARLASLAIPSIVVTHEPADVRDLATQVVVLEAGRVIQQGTPDALAADPASPFVRAFFGWATI